MVLALQPSQRSVACSGYKCDWWNEPNYECLGRNVKIDVHSPTPIRGAPVCYKFQPKLACVSYWFILYIYLSTSNCGISPMLPRSSCRQKSAFRSLRWAICSTPQSHDRIGGSQCVYIYIYILHVLHIEEQGFQKTSALRFVFSQQYADYHPGVDPLLSFTQLILLKLGALGWSCVFFMKSPIPKPYISTFQWKTVCLWSGKWRLPSFQVDFPCPARSDGLIARPLPSPSPWKLENNTTEVPPVAVFQRLSDVSFTLKIWIFLGCLTSHWLHMAWHHRKEQLGQNLFWIVSPLMA